MASAPFAFAQIRKPVTALKLSVREFGAKGDGTTKDTAAFQQALDRCSVLGGGEVLVPPGTYLTGAIALRSDTLLRLQELSRARDSKCYPQRETIRSSPPRTGYFVESSKGFTPDSFRPESQAMSLSSTRNAPRRSSGGKTFSIASSVSVGSARR